MDSKKLTIENLTGDYSVDNIEKMIENKEKNPGVYYLLLKLLVKTENKKLIENIILLLIEQKDLKWRHLEIVLPYFKNVLKDNFIEWYQKTIFDNIKIDSKLIMGLCSIEVKLLKLYKNKYVRINKDFWDDLPFEVDFSYEYLLDQIEKFIKKKFSKIGLERFLKVFPENKKYNLVFDGNNILLNKKGKLEIDSYVKLIKLYEDSKIKGYNPIVFIHARHLKTITKMGLKLNFNYIPTPYRYNDDWFCLYYAIKNNVNIVSRDIYRDHINQFDTQNNTNYLKIFLEHKKFDIKEDFSEIIYQQKNIPIIIYYNDHEREYIYIPGNKKYLLVNIS